LETHSWRGHAQVSLTFSLSLLLSLSLSLARALSLARFLYAHTHTTYLTARQPKFHRLSSGIKSGKLSRPRIFRGSQLTLVCHNPPRVTLRTVLSSSFHSTHKGCRTRTRLPELDSDCPKRLNPTPSVAADSPARAFSPVANTRPPQGGNAHTVCAHHIKRASAEKHHFLATFGPSRLPLRNALPTSFVKSPAPGAVVSTPSTLFCAVDSVSMGERVFYFGSCAAKQRPVRCERERREERRALPTRKAQWRTRVKRHLPKVCVCAARSCFSVLRAAVCVRRDSRAC
jgi:hypothetical protein